MDNAQRFGGKTNKTNKNAVRSRRLSLESLESREMLSVSTLPLEVVEQPIDVVEAPAVSFSAAMAEPEIEISLVTSTDIVTGLAVTGRSNTSVQLSWTSLPTATGYDIQWRAAATAAWGAPLGSVTVGNVTTVLITGLTANTSYDFRIRAKDAGTDSAWSWSAATPVPAPQYTVTTTTYAAPQTPTAPTGFQVSGTTVPLLGLIPDKTTNSIRFQWDRPVDPLLTYEIRYRKTAADPWTVVSAAPLTINTATINATIGGLEPGTTYQFQIRAINTSGVSSGWPSAPTNTLTEATSPEAPTNLRETAHTATTVDLLWDSVPDAVSYQLAYTYGFTEWAQVPSGMVVYSGTTALVTGLTPETEYKFAVLAKIPGNSVLDGYSSQSAPYTLITPPATPPATPTGLTTTAIAADSITLRWNTVPTATSYTLQYRPDGGSWITQSVQTSGITPTISETIVGLDANTVYEIRLWATNDAGNSAWTSILPTTLPMYPGNFRNTAQDATSVTLAWNIPVNDTGIIGYEIQYRGKGVIPWSAIISVSGGATTDYTLSTFPWSYNQYEFQIRAVKSGTTSDWSPILPVEKGANTDPGDRIADAYSIAIDGTGATATIESQKIGDGLYGNKDVDFYQFVVTADDVGKLFTFSTSGPSGTGVGNTYLRLFNDTVNNPQIAQAGSAGTYTTLEWIPTDAGTYYLGVSSYDNRDYNRNIVDTGPGGDVGNYVLSIQVSPTIPADFQTGGKTEDSVYVTWKPVTEADGYQVRYKLSSASGSTWDNPTTWLTVYAPDVSLLISGLWEGGLSGVDYDFQVRSFQDVPGLGTAYSEWSTTHTDTTAGTTDPGDTIDMAMFLYVDGTGNMTAKQTQKIGDGTHTTKDVDMFEFTVGTGSVLHEYTFTTSLPTAGTAIDTCIRIFDASGNELAKSTNTTGDATLTWNPLVAGTYYVGISYLGNIDYDPMVAGSGSVAAPVVGDYTLSVSVKYVDLVATIVGASLPPSVYYGSIGNTFSVTSGDIINNGTAKSSDYTVEFFAWTGTSAWPLNPTRIGISTLQPGLDPGDKARATLTNIKLSDYFTITQETDYYIGWRVVLVGQEIDLTNNQAVNPTQIKMISVDLETTSTGSVLPTEVNYGKTFSVTSGQIKNLSTVPSGNYTVTFYAWTGTTPFPTDAIKIDEVSRTSLAAGGTDQVTLLVIDPRVAFAGITQETIYHIGWEIVCDDPEFNIANNRAVCNNTIKVTGETPSTVVTIFSDVINAFDDEISLREAIMYANPGDTITFATSVYGQTIYLDGVYSNGQSYRELVVNKNLTIDGAGANITIDAYGGATSDKGNWRAFTINANCSVELVELKITGGYVTDSNGGGGILNNGNLTLTDCDVVGNTTVIVGSYAGLAATVTVTTTVANGTAVGSTAWNNAVNAAYNTAVASGGVAYEAALTQAAFRAANGLGTYGGGIYNAGTLTVNGGSITGNTALADATPQSGTVPVAVTVNVDVTIGTAATPTRETRIGSIFVPVVNTSSTATAYGGGIYSTGNSSKWTIANCDISNNTALAIARTTSPYGGSATATAYGGGIYSNIGGTLTTELSLTNSKISMNTAEAETSAASSNAAGSTGSFGGGIYSIGTNNTLTVTNSEILQNDAINDGGGIYHRGTMFVNNSTFEKNTALQGNGGGIYNTGGTLTMKGGAKATIVNNVAGISGGGIYNEGGLDLDGTASTTITIANNTATTGNGGGIYSTTGNLTVRYVDIQENTANVHGGGIYGEPYGGGSGGTLNVTNSNIFNNTAKTGSGGGIYSLGDLKVDNGSHVDNNVAEIRGGGIYSITYGGLLQVLNGSYISGNKANKEDGGGIYVFGGSLNVAGSFIDDNKSGRNGGGLYADTNGVVNSKLEIADSSVSNNKAEGIADTEGRGGGIYSLGVLFVTNNSKIMNNSVSSKRRSEGGGIYNSGGTGYDSGLTVANSTITGNSLSAAAFHTYGGGISCNGSALSVDDSTISSNMANYAGGIYSDAAVEVKNGSTIANNKADMGDGGGIYGVGAKSSVSVSASTISDNSAKENGGGISNVGTLEVTDGSVISGNSAYSGAGISSIGATATLTVTGSNISKNKAANDGGGIHNTGTLTVASSEIIGNSAVKTGGGINNTGSMTLTNSVMSGNSAESGGGLSSNGTLTTTNATIAGNTADVGGGMYIFGGTTTLNNTIVAQNSFIKNSADIHRAAGTITGKNNLIGNGAGQTSLVNGTDGNIVGVDPGFVDPSQGDYRLVPNSPAVNSGNNGLASGITLDLDGNARIFNGIVDMGAYEWTVGIPFVSAVGQPGSVLLSWAAVPGATAYRVYRLNDVGSYVQLTANITATTYVDSTARIGIAETYSVIALSGTWSDSRPVTATALPSAGIPQVTATGQPGSVLLTWDAIPGATAYRVYRLNDVGSYVQQTANITATTYVDYTARIGVTETYSVIALNGTWSDSRPVTATALPSAGIPQVTATGQPGSVSLTWATVPGATAYRVYRLNDVGSYVQLTANITATTYVDYTARAGVTETYSVIALNGTWSDSRPVTAMALPSVGIPQVTATGQPGSVLLTWDAIPGATAYRVYRLNDAGSFVQLTANITATTFVDYTARVGVTETYSVIALNGTWSDSRPVTATALSANQLAVAFGLSDIDIDELFSLPIV